MKAIIAIAAGLIVLASVATTYAKQTHTAADVAVPSCSATSPLAYQGDGTLVGSGFPADTVLSASYESGPAFGMFSVTTDGGGGFTLDTYGAWPGTTTITFYENDRTTTCSFEVA